VRRYVGTRKRQAGVPIKEVTVPQHHPLGAEAEVDFGQVQFYLGPRPVTGWMFVMRLCASGKGFHRVYLHQSQDAFLDGHVRASEHLGGVPGRIRYDNLKPAVTRVLRGRNRKESDRFVLLRSHYASWAPRQLRCATGEGSSPATNEPSEKASRCSSSITTSRSSS